MKLITSMTLVTLLLFPSLALGQYVGPSPYLAFDDLQAGGAVSPFASLQSQFTYFHLEDFEDGMLNTPGVSLREAAAALIRNTPASDSVDFDDGTIDGNSSGGAISLFTGSTSTFTFDFSSVALGQLPTHVGIVWTDIDPSDGLVDNVGFEAFDSTGASLGVFGPFSLGDNTILRTTNEDRFIGIINPSGISAVQIRTENGSTNWEVDHLQYGFTVAPQAPIAVDDTFQALADQPLNVGAPGVLNNDTDANNDPLTVVLVSGPSNASSFTLNSDGSFRYTANVGFAGIDSFTYVANDGTSQSNVAIVSIDVVPEPPSCLDVLRGPADAYHAFVEATLATELPNIQALAASGDLTGATALQQSTVAALVQEAANAVSATQIECANCIAQLQADGNDHLIPNVNTTCISQIHRIGTIQAGAVSQLENAIARTDPSPVSLQARDRYLREIGLNSSRTISSFDRFADRYRTIIDRHMDNGDSAAADAAVGTARSVLQRTSAARISRIQELCDNFVARAGTWPGSHQLIAAVTSAATAAMAEIQLAEAEGIREIEATGST